MLRSVEITSMAATSMVPPYPMTKSLPVRRVICHASRSAPCSPTKSSTTSAPAPSVMSSTCWTCEPSTRTVSWAPQSRASFNASSLGSSTTIRVALRARRHWMPMCPRPPAPMTTHVLPGCSSGSAFFTAWYAVSPASARAATSVRRLGAGVELDDRPRRCAEELRHPAVDVDAREGATAAVHVVVVATGAAEPARHQRVQDHGVARPQMLDGGADLTHPAGVLVAERVGQGDMAAVGPLPFDDVQVGAAQPYPTDLDKHVVGTLDRRLGHLLDHQALLVVVQPHCLHGDLPGRMPTSGGLPATPRHAPAGHPAAATWLLSPYGRPGRESGAQPFRP